MHSQHIRALTGTLLAVTVLAAQHITTAQTQVPAPLVAVTFSRDVAPILNKNCVSCHRPGEIAPMSLTSFQTTRPWAKSIRKAVADRAMPPWYADPTHGEFANDPRLSDADVATLLAWVDSGAAEGNPRDLPAPLVTADGWTLGTPDLIVSMTAPAQVPASGPRIIADYAINPLEFREDTYIERMEVLPSNRTVTHHAIVNVKDGTGTQRIGGYQPGGATTTYPAGLVRMIPKGASLALNMHYNTTGTPQEDTTKIGLVLARGRIDKVVRTALSGTRQLDIAPGAANYEAVGTPYLFGEDMHIVSLLPRMNDRGKDFRYTLVYPDGRSVVLLIVPKFNPDWQPSYVLKQAVAAPKGSRLETVAHFDNSAANKNNPDATQRVVFGPEIMNGYFDFTVDAHVPKTTAR